MSTNNRIIFGSIHFIVDFMIRDLLTYSYTLAFENELADLKGLIETDSLCNENENGQAYLDTDLELLDSLEDPGVILLIKIVLLILGASSTFRNLNNITEYEFREDSVTFDHACYLYNSCVAAPNAKSDLKEITQDIWLILRAGSYLFYSFMEMISFE